MHRTLSVNASFDLLSRIADLIKEVLTFDLARTLKPLVITSLFLCHGMNYVGF